MSRLLVPPDPELGADGGYLLDIESTTLASQFLKISILSTTPYTISFAYATPSGNNPSSNGNGLLLWQSQEPVYGPQQPLETTPVPSDTSSGEPTWSLGDGLQALDYIVGYSTDGGVNTAVATARINPDGTPGETFSPSLTLNTLTTGSVVVGYSLPPGYRARTSENRLGLYEGQLGAYPEPEDGAITPFPRDANSGAMAINHRFLRSTWYTIVYFAGPRPNDAAGFVRFQTGA